MTTASTTRDEDGLSSLGSPILSILDRQKMDPKSSKFAVNPIKLLTNATCLLLLLFALQSTSDKHHQKPNQSYTFAQAAASPAAQLPILSSIYSSPAHQATSDLSSSRVINQAHSKRDLSSTSEQQQQSSESVCQVKDGESVAIVEIEESRGSDTSQSTNPSVLPISGSVELDEIELKIESETHKYFKIENKSLRLTRALDRDAVLKENSTQIAQQPISSIYLQISCVDKRKTIGQRQRKVIIPVLVKVLDLNDNAPKFSKPTYSVQVDELAPVGTVVLDGLQAIDLDSAANGQIEYSLIGAAATLQPQQQSANKAQRLVQRVAPQQQPPVTTIQPPATTTASTASAAPSSSRPTVTSLAGLGTSEAPTTSTAIDTLAPKTSTEASVLSPKEGADLRRKNEPTINLNSEPIMNGPMEESDEEAESDEELLVTMDAANRAAAGAQGDSTGPSATVRPPSTGASGEESADDSLLVASASEHSYARNKPTTTPAAASTRARKRRRRSHGATLEFSSTTAAATTTTMRQDVPWTNLLASSNNGWQQQQQQQQAGDNQAADEQFDSSAYFALEMSAQTNRPVIILKRALDYESRRTHTLRVMATDRAQSKSDRLSSYATIVVRVLDGDDQPPVFVLDQGGCATSSVSQATTPSSESLFGPAVAGHSSSSSSGGTNKEEEEEELAGAGGGGDEHVSEFWDTLGLDDNPLDIDRGRSRPGTGGQKRRAGAKFNMDYLCLSSGRTTDSTNSQKSIAEYFATVMSGDSDYVLRVAPQAVRARDRDELNAPIRYSFTNGTPANYSAYFQINPLDATIKQVLPVEQTQVNEFQLWIQAQEQLHSKRASVAKLTISVIASDKSPPVLVPSSYVGQIDENSPIGARVFAVGGSGGELGKQNYLRVAVLDEDAAQAGGRQEDEFHRTSDSRRKTASYLFETTSDSFKVDQEGYVYVAKAGLDRDEPNQAVHMFQVTARQLGLVSSRSISSPISLNVSLLDQNDNPPVLVNATLVPLQMAANSRGGSRLLTQVRATDKDSAGENSRAHFSLRHVSNNGQERFRIDEESGKIEALGKFFAGEQFSLTVEVADELQRQAQGILEVLVIPGANSGGPQFVIDGNERDNSRGYAIEVNEAVPVHSVVLQVRAVDPENDQITYSLLEGSGAGRPHTHAGDFSINSKTGVLSVAQRLDREEISAYNLLVQARDSGGLATTRPIQVTITDANDHNPVFSQPSYLFEVEEGQASGIVGRVRAGDADAGDNGRVSYSLVELDEAGSNRSLFGVDEKSGEIRLLGEPLDYEKRRLHTLLVNARDNGEVPRTSSASVQVKVLDLQDEAPYFERFHLEVTLDENAPAGQRVAQVQARDPDSVAQVSYTLLAGDSGSFCVDAQTGVISTLQGLDYEQARTHTLLIGTNESLSGQGFDLVGASNRLNEAIEQQQERGLWSPIVRVDVHVSDLNDNAPQFEWSQEALLPVRVQDSAPLGARVLQLRAHDRDGSVPNNQVRFEIVKMAEQQKQQEQQATSERCSRLFLVDSSTGLISVGSDMKRELQLSECQLVIRAHDLPVDERHRLSSLATVTVFIDHLADISPATMIGFADSAFTVELEENSPANRLVKVLPVVNKPKSGANFPMSCEIVQGNEMGHFYVKENEQNDCELRTRDSGLDFEKRQRYTLGVKLNTVGGSSRSLMAQVQVNILDLNDNRPVFVPVSRYSQLTQQRYLAAIAVDAPSEAQVIQLRATDADSSQPNNLISYELLTTALEAPRSIPSEQDLVPQQQGLDMMEGKFKIDPTDGIVRTAQSIEDTPPSRLPLRLRVLARDNPVEASATLESIAEVVLNLIDDRHRIALVLKDTPASRLLENREQLLAILQERTGLIPGLERVESLKMQRNGSLIETDISGTDAWLYLIEPGTLRIVTCDDSRVRATLFDPRAQNSLADVINQSLGFPKIKIRLPFSLGANGHSGGAGASGQRAARDNSVLGSLMRVTGSANDRLALTLIIIALLIALLSAIVVIYQCGSLAGLSNPQTLAKHSAIYPAPAHQPANGPSHQQPNKSDQFFLAGLYQQPPPPAPSSQFGTSEKFPGGQQTPLGLSTGSTAGGHHDPYGQQVLNKYSAGAGQGKPMSVKEYETQMLKMSVLFDDNQSFDGQNLHDKALVNQNLVA